jgi:hypothetical protein
VFRLRPCDELITGPRSSTICKNDNEIEKAEARAQGGCTVKKKVHEVLEKNHCHKQLNPSNKSRPAKSAFLKEAHEYYILPEI